jgi:transcriptional regulator with XRE-family HTH domain
VPRKSSTAGKRQSRQIILRPLGAQLRQLRLERDFSQEYLAERAGLNYKYIGRIELARVNPGADVLVRLARALTVPIGALFETVMPKDALPHRLSPTDAEALSTALSALTTVVNRVVSGQPNPLPKRASRQSRR